ncbi:Alpha/Beta hydrolase protein [Gigaspora margarita]|uniref:Alpha/Beta hydrolase protein n=1 Tax=Gigaspora margarita TaxID=4874 RepID=A0A8H4B2D9_GIGMA|nr:Alpha/Beta hydrolase protein [Gigaspora margarita]
MGSSTSKLKYPHLVASNFPITNDGETITLSDGKQNDDINGPTISKLAIISSVAPYDAPNSTDKMDWKLKFAWLLAKNSPSLLSIIARLEAKFALSNPVKASCEIQLLGPPADKEVYEKLPEIEELFVKSILEMYTRGQVETAFWEYGLWGKDWGFKLSDTGKEKDGNIEVRCKVWHGEEDYGCTIAMDKYIADQIEGCESWDIYYSYCMGM